MKISAESIPDPDFVLNQARALDRVPTDQRGPLHGLAIGIKDIMNTKGTVPVRYLEPDLLTQARHAY